MLNTDICLAYDILTSQHENCCAWQERFNHQQPDVCGDVQLDCGAFHKLRGKAGADVEEFAESQDKWFAAFLKAWDKVTSNGFHNLRALEDTCSGDGNAPFKMVHRVPGEFCLEG